MAFCPLISLLVLVVSGVHFTRGDSAPFNPDELLCNDVDQCADLDGFCCEGLRGGCCEQGQCVFNSTSCKVGGERCGRERCSESEACLRWQPCVCCPNCMVPILPTCTPKCGDRACFRNESCVTVSNGRKTFSRCFKRKPIVAVEPPTVIV